MEKRKIFITESDYEKLEDILDGMMKKGSRHDRDDLAALEKELENCHIVSSRDIPTNVVTINSTLRLRDLKTNREMTLTLVFPNKANLSEGRMSVLSPIGTAILGYAAGDSIEWEVPGGTKMIRIEEILYQPEAAGDYHL